MKRILWLVSFLLVPSAASAQDTLWKCHDPSRPFRYAESEEDKENVDPPCDRWVEIRGERLAELLASVADTRWGSANVYLEAASEALEVAYPEAASGSPEATSSVYQDPEQYGMTEVAIEDAPVGSLVFYNGLGGILVEVRDPESGEWRKQVLYPSAVNNFEIVASDLGIPGKLDPKVVVPAGSGGPF